VHYRKIEERHFARLLIMGRFTGQDADAVREVIAEVKRGAERRYVMDLTGLNFIDSAGIGMLLVINGEAVATGKALAMVVQEGQVKKVITLTRIGMIIPQYDSLDAYVEACVPEVVLAPDPCAPDEDPLAIAARTLTISAA